MEQSSSPPRSPRNRKNLSMSSPSPETLYSPRSQVSSPPNKPQLLGSHMAKYIHYSTPSRYDQARLLEINAHSLFSKWFSESGKLVQGLFGSVMEMIEEENRFIVVLIGRSASLPLHENGCGLNRLFRRSGIVDCCTSSCHGRHRTL